VSNLDMTSLWPAQISVLCIANDKFMNVFVMAFTKSHIMGPNCL